MKIFNLQQKSPEWLAWRATGLGSSDAPVLVHGKHYKTTRQDLLKIKAGLMKAPVVSGWAVEQGVRNEPLLLEWSRQGLGVKAQPVCMVSERYPWLKSSKDGWDGDTGTIFEIKVIGREKHAMARQGLIPEDFLPQVHHQWLATDGEAKRVVYVSYCQHVPPRESKAVVIYQPSQNLLNELLDLEITFMRELEALLVARPFSDLP